MKKTIVIIILILLVASAVTMLYTFRPATTSYASSDADQSISSTDLYTTYLLDEESSDSMYIDKIIEVQGIATAVNMDSVSLTVTLEGDSDGGVLCTFSELPKDTIPVIGKEYIIKGKCAGFLMDVNLNFCSLVENKEN